MSEVPGTPKARRSIHVGLESLTPAKSDLSAFKRHENLFESPRKMLIFEAHMSSPSAKRRKSDFYSACKQLALLEPPPLIRSLSSPSTLESSSELSPPRTPSRVS